MTWKDKLELGIKEDAAYRKDNLPENEVEGVREKKEEREAAKEQPEAARDRVGPGFSPATATSAWRF